MADRIIKFKRGATATAQKAQKKGGEDQTSSFGQDVSAELALDMEKWKWAKKEREEKEAQKAQEEDDEEFRPQIIPRGVPSTSRPPATVTSTTPNEKRQKVTDPKLGATSFQQLFADTTTGRNLDDVIDQGVHVSTKQDKKVQKEDRKEEEPPKFVRGSIKARRLWIAGFNFDGVDLTEAFPQGKDISVLAVNEDYEDVYLTADDGMTLYTKGFIEHYGTAFFNSVVRSPGGKGRKQLLVTRRGGSTEFVRPTK
jgi:hypothetical protein